MSTRYPRPRERGPAAPAAPAAPGAALRDAQAGPPGAFLAPAPYAYAAAAAPNAALLIDFDNVTLGIQKDLQAELKALLSSDIIRGRVLVRRAYADWRRYPNYVVPLTENSVDLIWAPAYGASKKNATDIRLAVDAMELVFTRPEIGTYILLSGDSDFTSLVIKLKEYGKYVIGVGIRESASDLLVQNCDEYYSYNALAGLARTADEPEAPRDPWELVVEAVDRMARNGDTMRADRLKQVMQDIDPTFDEKNLGMPKFSRFVSEASHRGLLTLTRLESGQYEIAPARRESSRDRESGRDRVRDDRVRDDRVRDERGREDRGRDDRARDDRARDDRARDDRAREAPRPSARDAARDFARDLARDPSRDTAPTFDPTEAELAERSFDADEDDAEPASRADRADRGRSRRRGRGRSGRDVERGRTDEFAVPTADDLRDEAPAPAPRATEPRDLVPLPVAPTIGVQGERLTRAEAFDLVRRGVDALATSDDARVAVQPLREQVFALLGRDSESLSERMFPRIVQDAADNGVIRTVRDGDTIAALRAPRPAAPTVGDELSRAAAVTQAAPAPPPPPPTTSAAPRGMGPRGITRGRGGRLGAPPPELLLIGAVGGAPSPSEALAGDALGDAAADGPRAGGASGADPVPIASPAVDTVPVDTTPNDAGPVDVAPADAARGATPAVGAAADTSADVAPDTTAGALSGLGTDTLGGSNVPDDVQASGVADATDDPSADDDGAPAAAGRGRRRGRGRGRGGNRPDAPAAVAEAAPDFAPTLAPEVSTPQPAADDTSAPARGRGGRKVAAKAAAKAPAKTAAKRAARKRAANTPDAGGGDA